ncbi:MAG TPA: LamG-like jellyroll fold domain-containing protein [Patescibacteria group bacterium]
MIKFKKNKNKRIRFILERKRNLTAFVLAFAFLFALGAHFQLISRIFASSASSVTKTTDVDFSQGVFSSTGVNGTGVGANVQFSGSSYQDAILATPTVVSYWKMDNDWTDSKGSNNGTPVGAGFTSPLIGTGAGNFNGSSKVSFANSASINFTDDFSVEFVIKPVSVSGTTSVLDKGDGASVAGTRYSVLIENGKVRFITETGSTQNDLYSTQTISVGQQYHVVTRRKAGVMEIFINGVSSGTLNAPGVLNTENNPLVVGVYPNGSMYYNGVLDELAMYSSALDNATIAAHASSASQGGAPISGTWESATNSNAIETLGNVGWDNTAALTADLSSMSASATIQFSVRTADTAAGLSSAAYSNIGSPVTTNGTTTFTASNLGAVTPRRFVQIKAVFARPNGVTVSPQLNSFTINYKKDVVAPEVNLSSLSMKRTNGGEAVVSNGWTNQKSPYFSWNNAVDSESGVRGYCMYLGTDPAGNPLLSSGMLLNSPVDVAILKKSDGSPQCQFAVNAQPGATSSFDFGSGIYGTNGLATSTNPYYLNIVAIDNGNNVNTSLVQFQFRFDNTAPTNPAYITLPGYYVSDKSASFTWPTGGNSDSASDNISGLKGFQYKIGDNGTWYGSLHTGSQDASDLLNPAGGIYTFQNIPDFANINIGSNYIYLRTWDNAGNVSTQYASSVLKYDPNPLSAPQNVSATPSDSQSNSYSFSWQAPAQLSGEHDFELSYCYTVNVLPSAQTCSFTTAGVTSLSADAFATQPGKNTFYVTAKTSGGKINYDNYASVDFTYSGSAPGVPRNPDISDISIKTTANWKLALTWDEPSDKGAGINTYKIFRSENNVPCLGNSSAYSEVGSTSGTSYVDSGLSQKNYYYCIRACDSANSCGASSATVTKYPTGKFTSPANIVSGPDVTGVSTRKASIFWSTDRSSDSKISYGTKSGEYYHEEPSVADQTTDHAISLSNLDPDTAYYYRAKWTDEDGNTGSSEEKAFKTDPAPTVKDASVDSVGISSAVIHFNVKGAGKVKVYYGQSSQFGGSKEVQTSYSGGNYTVELKDLNDDTKYYYRINAFDADGNEYDGTTLDFTTLPRPRISNVKIQDVQDSAQSTIEIDWSTNTETSSIVSYYRQGDAGSARNQMDADFKAGDHTMKIAGLLAKTPYVVVVKGRDKIGNETQSDQYTFTTATDTRPPLISNLDVEGMISKDAQSKDSSAQLVISWDTDEPSTSQVEFGEGSGDNYSQQTQEDGNLTYNHIVVISGLTPSKVYHVRALSKDDSNNIARSVDTVTIAPKAVDNALDLVVSNLQQIFGFIGGLGN